MVRASDGDGIFTSLGERTQKMLKPGIVLTGIGVVFVGYALTAGVVPVIPEFDGLSRFGRWFLFAMGMLSLSIGIAILLAILLPEQASAEERSVK